MTSIARSPNSAKASPSRTQSSAFTLCRLLTEGKRAVLAVTTLGGAGGTGVVGEEGSWGLSLTAFEGGHERPSEGLSYRSLSIFPGLGGSVCIMLAGESHFEFA